MTDAGSEFQTETDGAAHRKERFAKSVRANGWMSSGVADERSVRVRWRGGWCVGWGTVVHVFRVFYVCLTALLFDLRSLINSNCDNLLRWEQLGDTRRRRFRAVLSRRAVDGRHRLRSVGQHATPFHARVLCRRRQFPVQRQRRLRRRLRRRWFAGSVVTIETVNSI